MSLFPGRDAFMATIQDEHPELAVAIAMDAGGAVARGDQTDAGTAFVLSQIRQLVANDPRMQVVAPGTMELSARCRAIIKRHRSAAPLHVGRSGPVEPTTAHGLSVGVLFADDPRFVCELSPNYPLEGVLQARPVDRTPPAPCNWRAAYPCTRSTRRANGYAFAWDEPFVIVWRICPPCAKWIEGWREKHVHDFAQEGARYVTQYE